MADENIVQMEGDDQEMTTAYKQAQQRFIEFARYAELENCRIVPAFENISVKAFFPVIETSDLDDMDVPGEHMYVKDVFTDGKTVFGTLNDDPQHVPGIKDGDPVSFPISRLSDWFLVPFGDKPALGGFTIDVLKRHMDKRQLAEYEQHPPLSWFKQRGKITAMEQLKQLPACKTCQRQDMMLSSYQDGVCGLCANGMVRCTCKTCNAPLIRPKERPELCNRCQQGKPLPVPAKSGVRRASAGGRATANRDMGPLAKIYTGLVIALLALVLIVLGFMVFDPAGGQAAGRTMMLGVGAALTAVLGGTLFWNLKQKKLGVVATTLQAIALVMTCIGVPVAVLGLYAMLQDRRS